MARPYRKLHFITACESLVGNDCFDNRGRNPKTSYLTRIPVLVPRA